MRWLRTYEKYNKNFRSSNVFNDNGFNKATKGLLQDIEDGNGINKKPN